MGDLFMNHRGIEEALRFLAQRCDGAASEDGKGFNGRDTNFGKDLALRLFGPGFHATESRYRLSDKQHAAALKMLRIYVGQLSSGGLKLPTDEELTDFLARRQEFEDTAQSEAPRHDGRLEAVGQSLRCIFPFNAELMGKLKAIKDDKGKQVARWSGTCWEIPTRYLAAVTALANWEIAPSAQTAYQTALAEIAAEQARQQGEVERLEKERQRRIWEAQQLLTLADLDAPLPGAPDRTLFPHQKDCVKMALQYRADHPELRGVLIADDMGLGKSIESLVIARAYQRLYHAPILVVCPASLQENWMREAAMVGVQIEAFSWAKQPQPLQSQQYILIADEAHYAQNPKSARGKAFMELATAPTCRIALPLTGTPIKNGRPVNMYTLLKALNHPVAKSKTEYEKRYCAARATRFSQWDATGASHLDELHQKITKEIPVMIRRTKRECLKFLPPKSRFMRPAEISTEAVKTFRATIAKLKAEFAERLRAKRAELEAQGEDPNIANMKAKKAEAIVALGQLRHASSLAKVQYTIEFAQEIVEEGNQVVIACQFKDAAEQIATALNAEIISGDILPKNRQPIVDRFQAGERNAIVLMGGAGGVGITLTAATYNILHDRPWTPGDAEQIEDRIYRIGQENPAFMYWIQAFDIDVRIDAILENKAERIEMVLTGKRKSMRGVGDIRDIAADLIDEFF